MAERRAWWMTWPGAVALGVVALLLASAALLTGVAYLVIPPSTSAGVDFEIAAPPAWKYVAFEVQALACLVLPALTVVWARRRWLGYTLLGLALSSGLGVVGLVQLGIL